MTAVPDLLAPIRERVEAATSLGEWETTRANDVVIYAPNGFGAYHLVAHADSKEDAAFIAAARTDIPRLLAALDAVEDLAKYLDTLAEGDQHYANLFRAAMVAALEGSAL